MRWLRRFLRSLVGYQDCPCCNVQAVKWHKYIIHHEDEPPMFGWWHCEVCDRATPVMPTALINKAAKSFGYQNFDEFALAKGFAASGIEARSDETRSGSAEGESPTRQGDA